MTYKFVKSTLAVASALWLGAASTAHAQKPIQLELGNWLASTAAISVGAMEPWKKLVEEKTNGRVKVNLYHGGVLGSSRAVLDDVRGGVYHVGMAIPAYYYDTAYFKLLVGELPFAFDGAAIGSKVMTEFVQKNGKDVFDKLGVKDVGVAVSDPYVILSTKPIRKLEDLKGERMRVAGKAWVPIVTDWGAVATPMQPENAYTALERGTLGVMQYSPAGAAGWKFFEVAPYVTTVNSPTVVVSLIMNKPFYEKLPDDLKKMFDEELNPAFQQLVAQTYERGAPEALKKMAEYFKERGKGEVINLSPEERSKFVASTQPAWDAWVAEADKRKMGGDAAMADFKEILKKNGIPAPF
ncbi:TRAP transporter substrate-binding protein DctP [Alcaligenaceae bacterium]|nr:TRAP transporter substrate-binding protein DctP [Alcaligenaceae bacterium]